MIGVMSDWLFNRFEGVDGNPAETEYSVLRDSVSDQNAKIFHIDENNLS